MKSFGELLFRCGSRTSPRVLSKFEIERLWPQLLKLCQTYEFGPSESYLNSFFAEDSLSKAEQPGYFLLLNNEFISGVLLFRVVADAADLDFVCVDPTVRKNGAGAYLLSAFEQECKAQGAQRILLEVSEVNAPAVALYEKCGYVQIARRDKYYRRKQDALIMEKQI